MSRRVFLSCYKIQLEKQSKPPRFETIIATIKAMRDFVEQRGCIIEFVDQNTWPLWQFDVFIHVMEFPFYGSTFLSSIFCNARSLEQETGRPRVFKVWCEPEAMFRSWVNKGRKFQQEWPPGWFGSPAENEKEFVALATRNTLRDDERELLFRQETQPEILKRLASFLEALPPA